MRIETERLLLRKPQLDDVDRYLPIASDEEAMRFIGGVRDRTAVAEQVSVWLERWRDNGFGQFVVERRGDGAFLGRVGLLVWDTRTWTVSTAPEAGEHGQVELGWALGRPHWGHGYATEAASAVRDWAVGPLGVDPLVSLVHPDNARSARVAEKLGAVPTETIELFGTPAVVWVYPR